MQDLTVFHEPFKTAVLHHIRTSLPVGEWKRFRVLAGNSRRCVPGMPPVAPDISAEALVDGWVADRRWDCG